MFYYLRGQVAAMDQSLVVIDCGVGFSVNTTTNTLARLKIGEEAKLFTHCAIREDAFDIYGFSTRQELDTYKMLISINGVGAKAALSLLPVFCRPSTQKFSAWPRLATPKVPTI